MIVKREPVYTLHSSKCDNLIELSFIFDLFNCWSYALDAFCKFKRLSGQIFLV